MSNSHFKRKSAVFECHHCGRRTRDTNGDNGRIELCGDCYQGSMLENGWLDTDDEAEKAQYDRDMRAAYQRAVDKGGLIDGYTATVTKAKRAPDAPQPTMPASTRLSELATKAAQAASMTAADVREAHRCACQAPDSEAVALLLQDAIADARRLADRLALIATVTR